MTSRKQLGIRVGVGALVAAVAATSVQAVDTLKLGIGVRETGVAGTIGSNGGNGGSGIEWVRGTDATALTLNADDTWQFFTYTFGTDPVTAVTGVSGNGTLSSPNLMGTLEHIAIRNATPTTGEIKIYFDDVTHTVNSSQSGTPTGTYVIADFEAQAFGSEYMFQEPRFSPTSAAFTADMPNISRVVDGTVTAPHSGSNSYEANFQFNSASTASWIRYNTSTYNPIIDFTPGNTISFWAKATIAAPPPPTMFWNVWTGGDWDNGSNWSNAGTPPNGEPIPGAPVAVGSDPNGGGDVARFWTPATGTPAPQTINVGGDKFLNQLLIDNTNTYTFTGGTLVMTSINNPPKNGTATISSSNGSHNINVNDIYLNASLVIEVKGAGNTMTITSPISLLPTIDPLTDHTQYKITKTGDGTAVIGNVNYGYLVVSGGTLTVTPGSTLTLVANTTDVAPPANTQQALNVMTGATLNLTNTSPSLTHRFTNSSANTTTDSVGSTFNDGTINMSGGTLNTQRITIAATRGNLNLSNGATVNIGKYFYGNLITVADSSITIAPNGGAGTAGGVTNIIDLTLSGTSFFEVNDNDMVLNIDGTNLPGLEAKIRGYLASGYASGNWNGNGIRSAAANADANHNTALGYASGADLFGAVDGTFSGFGGVKPTSVLIKYTYYGDANLNGKVDLDDYVRIDRGMAKGLTGWFNGDFNYDGLINSADYALIDRVYIQQGGALSGDFLAAREGQFGAEYVSSLLASVPEPSLLGAASVIGLSALSKRRRQA